MSSLTAPAPVIVGLATGCAGALALVTLVASVLYEVRVSDPIMIAAVVALVGGVGVLALRDRRAAGAAHQSSGGAA